MVLKLGFGWLVRWLRGTPGPAPGLSNGMRHPSSRPGAWRMPRSTCATPGSMQAQPAQRRLSGTQRGAWRKEPDGMRRGSCAVGAWRAWPADIRPTRACRRVWGTTAAHRPVRGDWRIAGKLDQRKLFDRRTGFRSPSPTGAASNVIHPAPRRSCGQCAQGRRHPWCSTGQKCAPGRIPRASARDRESGPCQHP